MFRRRPQKPENADPKPPAAGGYSGLRDQILNLDPAAVGLRSIGSTDRVWGCVMETGYPNGTATLVCLRDGTTSLYTSSGFGIIGGGAHQAVVQANTALLAALTADLDRLPATDDRSLPSVGRTLIRALTYDGRVSTRAPKTASATGKTTCRRSFTPPKVSSHNFG